MPLVYGLNPTTESVPSNLSAQRKPTLAQGSALALRCDARQSPSKEPQQPPRTTRLVPWSGPLGSVCSFPSYSHSNQSLVHSQTFPSMSNKPHALGFFSATLFVDEPLFSPYQAMSSSFAYRGSQDPARHAYSHSASVGRYPWTHLAYACASSHVTLTIGCESSNRLPRIFAPVAWQNFLKAAIVTGV